MGNSTVVAGINVLSWIYYFHGPIPTVIIYLLT
ncbi:hypothetical protein YPC_0264 [Yersinia pestis biovar Medievalis str. Harbin 35]|nr:hypothetical protein YPC_0264 [Yersinia pestis biovar Medievalis str. Harbin 35]EEO74662.1 hypothetical protein YP516_4268 [Yersinia pestis Nepal516]EEO82399.1 hypothetical protein YPF_0366 [Yersinia pestis biovar Orientalis str. India 195]EEO86366.1 hypothetical protein YPH_2282 [Yersinia pestis biovar Orientalis str. PEXU2]EEO92668.1 hypothetical protein YPS_0102 [Yersinia pestis Pestoides A]EKS47860.1 hypothetical protein INS_00515 [Yersinia pestis INS]ERP73892.1 hypothetical protein L3